MLQEEGGCCKRRGASVGSFSVWARNEWWPITTVAPSSSHRLSATSPRRCRSNRCSATRTSYREFAIPAIECSSTAVEDIHDIHAQDAQLHVGGAVLAVVGGQEATNIVVAFMFIGLSPAIAIPRRLLGFTTRPKLTIIQSYVRGGNLHELLRVGSSSPCPPPPAPVARATCTMAADRRVHPSSFHGSLSWLTAITLIRTQPARCQWRSRSESVRLAEDKSRCVALRH